MIYLVLLKERLRKQPLESPNREQ